MSSRPGSQSPSRLKPTGLLSPNCWREPRVFIYRGPILRGCDNRRQVIREIRDTVVHELGHHFGLDEDDMPY